MFAASKTDGVSGGYQISRSLRFNSADSAYLNRTPASAGNRRTWTWSAWVKRGKLGDWNYLFQGTAGNPTGSLDDGTAIRFASTSDTITFYNLYNGTNDVELSTTQVFRDPSAWYHIVASVDTTQATASNRVKLYVNGTQITVFNTATYPSQNADLYVNSANPHLIGALSRDGGGAQLLYDGLQTEVYLVDGTQLTPSSFGETNAQTGVWQPKAYSGSYGTNGFYLNFSDNSNTTAATLGKDYSGNGNNWTPNNFSVTAGAGNDSLVDSPTSYGTDTGVGGTVRGNYATLNPLQNGMTNAPRNGNLEIAGSADIYRSLFGTFGVTSGKWYFEVVITSGSGVTNVAWSSSTDIYQYAGQASTSYGYELENGNKINNGGTSAYGSALTTNDVFMCAVDMDNLKLFFGKNGTWFASSDPVAGTSPAYTFAAGTYFFQMRPYTGSSSVVTTNFGQRAFAYTAPSGFKALCTQNLPTPTIGATTATQAGKYFNPVIYTGDGVNGRAVTGVGFQPDMVWVKGRSTVSNHALNDVLRGGSRTLFPNTTEAEYYDPDAFVKSFTSDGFTVGSLGGVNGSGATYVGWSWKANGTGVTNTAGSITSTVSANTTSGFSVVTWTGTGPPATVGHGLGVAPKMIIIKNRSSASNWVVGSSSLTAWTYYLKLNLTDAEASSSDRFSGAPSSTVFSIGADSSVNGNGALMVAYCFAEVAGYSKFGSYTGNGSSDGPFVYCGFRPRYIMVKCSTENIGPGSGWHIIDTARSTYNAAIADLFANASYDEATIGTSYPFDIISNGFKVRNNNSYVNNSGQTYIFAAFAEAPFKYSLAR
jgi:hypothetical protein